MELKAESSKTITLKYILNEKYRVMRIHLILDVKALYWVINVQENFKMLFSLSTVRALGQMCIAFVKEIGLLKTTAVSQSQGRIPACPHGHSRRLFLSTVSMHCQRCRYTRHLRVCMVWRPTNHYDSGDHFCPQRSNFRPLGRYHPSENP